MELYRDYVIKPTDCENYAQSVERVDQILRKFGGANSVGFCFQVAGYKRSKIDVVGRAIKAFPELAQFKYEYKSPGGISKAISNLGSDWYHGNPKTDNSAISLESLLLIAHRIPKSFPFFDAEIIFDGIQPLECRESPKTTAHIRSVQSLHGLAVAVRWSYAPGGYDTSLRATISLDTPPDTAPRLPSVPPRATQLLSALGKISNESLFDSYSGKEMIIIEKQKKRGETIGKRYEREIGKMLAVPQTLTLANGKTLPLKDAIELTIGLCGGFPSSRKIIGETFRVLGYKRSKQRLESGFHKLIKRSPKNNIMEVTFYFPESVQHPMPGSFCVGGMNYRVGMSLLDPVALNQPTSYFTGETAVQYILSCACLVKQLEATFVPEIDDLLDTTPLWYLSEIGV